MKNLILISIVATAAVLGGCQHNPNFGNNLARDPMFNMGMQMLQQSWQPQQRQGTTCRYTGLLNPRNANQMQWTCN